MTNTGPIPARAREPETTHLDLNYPGAYPRSRGGTRRERFIRSTARGLSPLARGNRRWRGQCCARTGPIPARAGEPWGPSASSLAPRAYPRSRGGTPFMPVFAARASGLSPLARGNPAWVLAASLASGPIPARAGEPPPLTRVTKPHRAYPRSRGGTLTVENLVLRLEGLSPLARGNRFCGVKHETP